MKIYITGVSGAGKSSIARLLTARGITAVDMDDELCHRRSKHTGEETEWQPGRSEEWYAEHGWICDAPALTDILKEHEDVVVVGLSSNQDDYLPLFDKVFVLRTTPETVVARINSRTDNEYGKHPAEQARLLKWHKDFEDEMLAKGAIPLDAERPLEELVEEVASHVS